MDIKKEYERWLASATADADVAVELKTLDDAKINWRRHQSDERLHRSEGFSGSG